MFNINNIPSLESFPSHSYEMSLEEKDKITRATGDSYLIEKAKELRQAPTTMVLKKEVLKKMFDSLFSKGLCSSGVLDRTFKELGCIKSNEELYHIATLIKRNERIFLESLDFKNKKVKKEDFTVTNLVNYTGEVVSEAYTEVLNTLKK